MRKLPAAAQEERRRQVIGLRQRGLTYGAIAEQVGLSRTGVFDICQRFAAEGAKGLASKPRGRKPDEQRLLDAAQEAEVQGLIRRHTPDELGLPFALWSRAAVGMLIARRCGVELAVRTAASTWRAGASPPRSRSGAPTSRTRRRCGAGCGGTIRPSLARARRARGAVFWGDETGLRSDDVRGRSYAPRGRTPLVRVCHKRAGLSLISAVANKGRVALDGRGRRGQRPDTHSLPPAPDPGRPTQGVPDPGPSAGAPGPPDPGLAGRAPVRNRGPPPAPVQPGAFGAVPRSRTRA
jgi:transposase